MDRRDLYHSESRVWYAPTVQPVGNCPDFGYDPDILEREQAMDMIRISSTEFGKEVGRYQDAALSQPVIVTRNGRDRTVMISADEYRRLMRRDRAVLGIEDFSDAEIDAVRRAEPSREAEGFNPEVEP